MIHRHSGPARNNRFLTGVAHSVLLYPTTWYLEYSTRYTFRGVSAVAPEADNPTRTLRPNPNAIGWPVLGCCGLWKFQVTSFRHTSVGCVCLISHIPPGWGLIFPVYRYAPVLTKIIYHANNLGELLEHTVRRNRVQICGVSFKLEPFHVFQHT